MFYMITRQDCSYCDRAKELLKKRGDSFEAHLYTDHPMIKKLMIRAGLNTVPQIWYRGTYIGGYENLTQYLKEWDEE